METMNLFDIQTYYEVNIPLPPDSRGTVFLLGSRSILADVARQTNKTVLNGIDRSMAFYDYKVRIMDVPLSMIESEGYNIICIIENPLSHEAEYITASAEIDAIPLAVSSVINEMESTLKDYYKEAIIIHALHDPEGFEMP